MPIHDPPKFLDYSDPDARQRTSGPPEDRAPPFLSYTRHLPGQHEQEDHAGGGGGGSAIPASNPALSARDRPVVDPRDGNPALAATMLAKEMTIAKMLAEGRDTLTVYDKVAGHDGKYTLEREEQQRGIIDKFVNAPGVKSDQECLIMGGVPGAGKTTFLESDKADILSIETSEYVIVNPDDIKTEMIERGMIPEYPGLTQQEAATLMHEESSDISYLIASQAQAEGKNILFDISMSSSPSVEKRLAELTDEVGPMYNTTGVFIDRSVSDSMASAVQRWEEGGRLIPLDHLKTFHDETWGSVNRATFEDVKGSFNSWMLVDNTNFNPQVVEQSL